jgi:type I restriction enzyme, S subunit
MARLGDICEVVSGSTPKSFVPEFWDGDVKWITPAELNVNSFYIFDSVRHITELGVEKTSLKILPTGTVILSSRAPIGKVAIAGSEMYCNQGFKNLICSDLIFNEYLYFFLKGKTGFLNYLGRGATFKEISKLIVENIEIPLPDINIQHKIAARFLKLCNLISIRKQQLEKLNQLGKSQFIEMFGDINANEKAWQTEPLGELCEIVRGGSPRPIEKYIGGTIPWIKIGDATDDDNIYLNSTKEHIIESGVKKSRVVKSGSLIFANCGVSLGFARIITFDGCIHDGWLAFENIDERLDKIFLLKALNLMTYHFREIAPAGTQPNLNTAIMKAYKQIIPPIELQREYIAFVQQVDKSKFTIQQSLDKLNILYKSLMQQYFG